MTQAHHDVRIARPIEDVFDFLADGANNPLWQPPVVSTVREGETLGVGSVFRQTMRHPLGYKVSSDYRVTEYERPHGLVLKATSGGPFRPTLSYALRPTGAEETDVRCTLEYRPSGIGRLALPPLALLHPVFAWEASWVGRTRVLLEPTDLAA